VLRAFESLGSLARADADDHALIQKQVADLHGCFERTTWVVTQIKNQTIEPMFLGVVERFAELGGGGLVELRHAHVR
jgi:hypothetical protein